MSIKKSQELKQLKTQESKLKSEIEYLSKEIKSLQVKKEKALSAAASVEDRIKRLRKGDIIVTEHAILRYLERVKGLSLDEVKKEILDGEIDKIHCKLGDGKFPLVKGGRAVIKNNTIISVVR